MGKFDFLKDITYKVNFVAIYKFIKYKLLGKKTRTLGAIKDKEDPRDIMYKVFRYKGLPSSTNRKNINEFPYRYDQLDIGSCVGHGVVEAFRRVLHINKQPDFEASRLFAYYIARKDKNNDTGASIRDAFKAINREGLCSERIYPYKTCKFAHKPSDEAYKEALDHQSIRYERLPQNKEAIKDAINRGYPIVYGKLLFESFMSNEAAKTGIIHIPDSEREQCYGGHCMVIFDYNEFGTVELNSWGESWGDKGTCEVPWNYVLDPNLSFDFWVLYLTE